MGSHKALEMICSLSYNLQFKSQTFKTWKKNWQSRNRIEVVVVLISLENLLLIEIFTFSYYCSNVVEQYHVWLVFMCDILMWNVWVLGSIGHLSNVFYVLYSAWEIILGFENIPSWNEDLEQKNWFTQVASSHLIVSLLQTSIEI